MDLMPPSRKRVPNHRTRKRPLPCLKPSAIERNLGELLSRIDAPTIVQDRTAEICKTIRRHGFGRGYSASTVAKALVYTAYRICQIPVTLPEFSGVATNEQREIARCYYRLCRKLELKVPKIERIEYLLYLATKKKIPQDAVILAGKILDKAKKNRLAKGANPLGVAAAALYIASIAAGYRMTQKELAKVAGVSEVTIRTDYKILQNVSLKKTDMVRQRRV